MSRARGAAVVVLVVFGLVSMSSTCLAADGPPDQYHSDFHLIGYVVTGLQDLGTCVPTAVLAVNISRGHRPSDGWLATGYVLGSFSLLSGISSWIFAGMDGSGVHSSKFWPAGIPGIVLGVSNIVMASYGLTLPVAPEGDEEGQGAQLSFAPLVAPDGQGGYYSGIGINVVGW